MKMDNLRKKMCISVLEKKENFLLRRKKNKKKQKGGFYYWCKAFKDAAS